MENHPTRVFLVTYKLPSDKITHRTYWQGWHEGEVTKLVKEAHPGVKIEKVREMAVPGNA